MKKLKTIQTLFKIAAIMSKIAFIVALVSACICAVGLICLPLGGGAIFKLGGASIYGLLKLGSEEAIGLAAAALAGWLVTCIGEAVLARFAERCFKHELQAGTPFTADGAWEMKRFGILAIALPCGCSLLATIIYSVAAEFAQVASKELSFSCEGSVALGVMFIILSLICGCAAELIEGMHMTELEEAKRTVRTV